MKAESDSERLSRHRQLHSLGGPGIHPEVQARLGLGAAADKLVHMALPMVAVLAEAGDTDAQDLLHAVRDLLDNQESLEDSIASCKAKLADLGWTAPGKPAKKPQVPVVAWMHPVAQLVTVDEHAYTNLSGGKPRELVLKEDVYDHVEWLEKGIDEWRAVATKSMDRFRQTNAEFLRLKETLDESEAGAARPVMR